MRLTAAVAMGELVEDDGLEVRLVMPAMVVGVDVDDEKGGCCCWW